MDTAHKKFNYTIGEKIVNICGCVLLAAVSGLYIHLIKLHTFPAAAMVSLTVLIAVFVILTHLSSGSFPKSTPRRVCLALKTVLPIIFLALQICFTWQV